MSGKKRTREPSEQKEDSPEPRSRPGVSRSRNSKDAPGSSSAKPNVYEEDSNRKSGTMVAGSHKRAREPKTDSSKSVKQHTSVGAAVATRTRAAAELSGAAVDSGHRASPTSALAGLRAGVIPAPAACLTAPILVSNAAPGDARSIINPVLIPQAFAAGPIAPSTIPALATRNTSFPSPGLSAVTAVPALACSALQLPSPALTSFLPAVQGPVRTPPFAPPQCAHESQSCAD